MIRKQFGIFFSLLIIIQVAAAGCTRTQQGAAIGGAAGGLTGYMLTKDEDQGTQIAAVVAGAVVGGLIGGAIGNYMDKADEERLQGTQTDPDRGGKALDQSSDRSPLHDQADQ